MAFDSKSIITLQEAKEFLGIDRVKKVNDPIVTGWVSAATLQLEQVTNAKFSNQTFSELFTSQNTARVIYSPSGESGVQAASKLQKINLTGINIDLGQTFTVNYDPARSFADTTELTIDETFFVDVDRGIVTLSYGMGYYVNSIKIDYTAGFVVGADDTISASAPEDLKLACKLQVAFLRARSRTDNVGLEGDRTLGRGERAQSTLNWMAKGGVTPEAAAIVARYKRLLTGNT